MTEYRHTVTEIAPHTWCLSEYGLVNVFLIEGNDKAALIDAGIGIGNVRKTSDTLTKKPYVVLLTHGHADHYGGVGYYYKDSPVYMSDLDKKVVAAMPADNQMKKFMIETRVPVRFPGEGHVEDLLRLIEEEKLEITEFDSININDGDEFDIGGRILKTYHTPGHSDGSMCFLDSQNRILFSGDTVNKSIILKRQKDNDPKLIRSYNNTLKKLWELSSEYDQLAIGHDGILIDKDIVKDYLDLTTGLLDGSITGKYEEINFRAGDVARLRKAELWYQCDR